jgi:CubicO group peptidase (beta-lactamase class C family)
MARHVETTLAPNDRGKAITVITSQAVAINRFGSRSGRQMSRIIATLLFYVLLGALPSQAAGQPLVWPTAHWPTSTPEAQGMNPSALADLVDFGAASPIDSILVLRHGHVVLDVYYAPFRHGLKHAVNSVTKAVVGTLAGMAFKQGALGPLDTPVLRFFAARNSGERDERKLAMTLASLLDSNSGLEWKEPLDDDAVPESMLEHLSGN